MKFKKNERICSLKIIEQLFMRNNEAVQSFLCYPLKVVFLENENYPTHQVLISVSKRKFKHAVERNLHKRRIREAYRLNKPTLNIKKTLSIGFILVANTEVSFLEIEKGMKKTIKRLNEIYAE